MLADFLREPLLSGIDINATDRLRVHRQILEQKPLIRDVFTEIHRLMWKLSRKHLSGDGSDIEIGAGVFAIKATYPSVLSTDIIHSEELDRVLDAQDMDLLPESVRTIFGQHCFHHLPDPERFLTELRRVLIVGGGAVLVEPYWSPTASLLFKHIFKEEDFDIAQRDWTTSVHGAMGGANQALSYIVFERDRARYDQLFPDLPIVYQAPLSNYLRYLMSGGLNFRQLVPDVMAPLLQAIETLISPLNRWLALHHVLVLKKTGV